MFKATYSIGIILKIVNLLLFTAYSLLIMKFASDIAPTQLCFFITSLGALMLLPIVLILRLDLRISMHLFMLHVLRASFNCIGIVCWVFALQSVGPNEATAISYTIPIFTAILAKFICGEKLDKYCVIGIVFGAIGISIALRPSIDISIFGTGCALLSSMMWACYDITCKKQTVSEHPLRQAFYNFAITSIILSFCTSYDFSLINSYKIFEISIISAVSATNVVVLFLAYRYTPIVLLMPFSYLRLFFMAVATYWAFDYIVSKDVLIGTTIVIISSSFVFLQQRKGNIIL